MKWIDSSLCFLRIKKRSEDVKTKQIRIQNNKNNKKLLRKFRAVCVCDDTALY